VLISGTRSEPGSGDTADQQAGEPPGRDEPACGLGHEVERRQQAHARRGQAGDRQGPGELAGSQPGQPEGAYEHPEPDGVHRAAGDKAPPGQGCGAGLVASRAAGEGAAHTEAVASEVAASPPLATAAAWSSRDPRPARPASLATEAVNCTSASADTA
jgi:hypothetical protein